MHSGTWVVAVPARNEAEHVENCLRALADQDLADQDLPGCGHIPGHIPGHIVLLVNNSTDGTAALARSVPVPPAVTLHVLETVLPAGAANAGTARRHAMDHAATLAGPHGVLLTTDADGLVDPNWIAANLACIQAGADAVCGWVELFPADWSRIPTRLHEDDARECAYDALCDEIEALLDPDPADPLPRHTQNSGASIAVTARAYHRCGGVPAVVCGEDRALVAALRRVDARIRHAPEVHVQVSGRITGRCQGGMADTIRRRLTAPDEYVDDRLEPAAQCALRAALRAEARQAHATTPSSTLAPSLAPSLAAHLAKRLRLPPETLPSLLATPHFGTAWARIEAASPLLARQTVPVRDLAAETAAATALLTRLRSTGITGEPDLVPQD